jgi:DNA repair protein RecN (Recombination protein N)
VTDPTDRDARPGELEGVLGRLAALCVDDLALLERVRVELPAGLIVLSGETGAGKSLLIDALGLVLGARADTGLVRHGAEAARVEARFEGADGGLVATREVSASGRSAARLDGEAVTAGRMAEVIGPLVDIHGQHDQQRLLDDRHQRDLLDAFGEHHEARAAMAEVVARWRENREALADLPADDREVARRLDVLAHEAAEIEAARLRPGEAAEIEGRLAAARHAEAAVAAAGSIRSALTGEDAGAREATAGAAAAATRIARLDPRFGPLAERLDGLVAELDDAADQARILAETIDHDPAELARLEERLSVIYALERRYGDDEAAVVAHGERCRAEAERLQGLDEQRIRRRELDATLLREVADAASTLSALRMTAAGSLAEAVGRTLVPLGFPADAFGVGLGRRVAAPGEPAVEIDGDALAFDAAGVDEVVFRFAPNPGEPARPLARIASGGELSRVALAIREVLAGLDDTPTLVFDEIDSGIGGRSAEPVGRALWALARRHQVLCVTHLAQIAAYADTHLRIAKVERDGRTSTTIERLEGDARVGELADMLAGAAGGEASRASARELDDRAAGWRGERLVIAG